MITITIIFMEPLVHIYHVKLATSLPTYAVLTSSKS